ncbi:MAG TPA: hypothetical protein VFA61_11465 [Candidatus Udaeobacter sp.]|nr:hypothetical protein [Candidatus Udaeobacter sp.]
MKKILILLVLISFAIICSCQKRDSTAEQQLAQQKAELDAREKALDERLNTLNEKVNVLDGKVKALAEKEQANLNTRMTPSAAQAETLDPAQVQAERDRALQQFYTQMRGLIPDNSQANPAKVQKDRMTQNPLAPRQGTQEESQNQRQDKWQTRKGWKPGAVFPSAEASSPTPSPAAEAASPTLSPTPE